MLRLALAYDDGDVTVDQAPAMRANQARLAAHYAQRAEEARAAGQYGAMRHWLHEYRRATMHCRLLGERIRERAARPAKSDRTVAPTAPRAAADIAPAGEAA
jgi:hypothetical protein